MREHARDAIIVIFAALNQCSIARRRADLPRAFCGGDDLETGGGNRAEDAYDPKEAALL